MRKYQSSLFTGMAIFTLSLTAIAGPGNQGGGSKVICDEKSGQCTFASNDMESPASTQRLECGHAYESRVTRLVDHMESIEKTNVFKDAGARRRNRAFGLLGGGVVLGAVLGGDKTYAISGAVIAAPFAAMFGLGTARKGRTETEKSLLKSYYASGVLLEATKLSYHLVTFSERFLESEKNGTKCEYCWAPVSQFKGEFRIQGTDTEVAQAILDLDKEKELCPNEIPLLREEIAKILLERE